MADGFRLGAGFIEIDPNLEGFEDKVKAAIARDKIEMHVPVRPDTTGFKKKLETELAKDRTSVKVEVDPDASKFKPKLTAALAKDKATVDVEVNPDAKGFKPKLTAALAKDRTTIDVGVNPNTTGFEAKLKAALTKNRSGGVSIPVSADTDKFKVSMDKAVAEESHRKVTVTVDTNKSQLDAAMSKSGGDAGGIFKKAFGAGASGASPGAGGGASSLAGIPMPALIGGAVVGLSVLPAAMASLGALSGVALGAGLALELNKSNKKITSALNLAGLVTSVKDTLRKAVQPMVVPLEQAFRQISGWVKSLQPQLTTLFSQSAKYLMPFLKGFESLVNNFLPGFNALLKAAGPSVQMFSRTLGQIGSYMSQFFKALIPGLAGSNKAFSGLIQLLGGLLVSIGKIASAVATGLGGPLLTLVTKVLNPLISAIANNLMPLMKALNPLFQALANALGPVARVLTQILGIVVKVLVQALSPLIKVISSLLPFVSQIAVELGQALLGALKAVAPLLTQFGALVALAAKTLLPPLLAIIVKIIPPLMQVSMAFLQALIPAMQQLLPPLAKLIVNLQPLLNLLVKIIPIVITFAANVEINLIQRAIIPLVTWMVRIVGGIVNVIAWFVKWAGTINDWKNLWQQVWTNVKNWWDNIVRTILGALDTVKKNVTNWINNVRNAISGAWDAVYQNTSRTWSRISNVLHDWWANIINFFTGAYHTVQKNLAGAWNNVLSTVQHIWGNIESFFSSWWGRITGTFSRMVSTVRQTLTNEWNTISGDVSRIWGGIENFFSRFWTNIQSGATNAVNGFKLAWSQIQNAFSVPVNFLVHNVYDDGIRKLWNTIVNAVGLKNLDLPQLAKGGVMPGYTPGKDPYTIKVSGGEGLIVPEAVVAMGGKPAIDAINYKYAGHRGAGKPGNGTNFATGGVPQGAVPVDAQAAQQARINAKTKQLATGPNVLAPVIDIAKKAAAPVVGLAKDVAGAAKIIAALATGNTTALTNALSGMISTNAAGNLAKVMLAIPKTLLKDMLKAFTDAGGATPTGTAGISAGSSNQNGVAIFNYLMKNGFNAVGAAGALASMYGESGWNPESHEPPGPDGPFNGGLMGWTPLYNYMGHISSERSNVPSSVVTGNANSDFQHQLKAIIEYINVFNGGGRVIGQMNSAGSVLDAANVWGVQVERYGINDVHSAGIQLATSIMNNAQGAKKLAPDVSTRKNDPTHQITTPAGTYAKGTGSAAPGWAWVGERGAELVRMVGGETVLDAITSSRVGGLFPGFAAGTKDTVAEQYKKEAAVASQHEASYNTKSSRAQVLAAHYTALAAKKGVTPAQKTIDQAEAKRYMTQAKQDAEQARAYALQANKFRAEYNARIEQDRAKAAAAAAKHSAAVAKSQEAFITSDTVAARYKKEAQVAAQNEASYATKSARANVLVAHYDSLASKKGITAAQKSTYEADAKRYQRQASLDANKAHVYAEQANKFRAEYNTRIEQDRAKHAAAVVKADARSLKNEQKAGESIIAALAGQFTSAGGVPSASNISSDLTNALKSVTTYYSGAKAKTLENALQKQAAHMQTMLTKYTNAENALNTAKAYAGTVTSNLSGYAGLSSLNAVPSTGSGAPYGGNVARALQQKLTLLKTFGSMLKSAASKKINTSFLQQAIALGPDGGTQYLQAILSGGSSLISTINSLQSQIDTTETSIGQQAANAIYDPKSTGKGFLLGLQSQASALNKEMQKLGAAFATSVAKDLKIPAKDLPHFAAGGFAPAGTLAVVGENGPEVVRFGQSGTVHPHHQSQQRPAPNPVNINFYGTQYPTPEQMAILKLEFSRQLGPYNV